MTQRIVTLSLVWPAETHANGLKIGWHSLEAEKNGDRIIRKSVENSGETENQIQAD
ncbi:hypothetical protein ZHAS_00018544 [Anopheles sinensis]|uniref:Uncharacterized protein n=1 Tax=Anopheles sinensis TaxID=74873 RepID=A0A084WJW1_ANOSI|nr:hypothetical protein ZHAS_00018544 [Anopheles sinensis]